MRRFHRAAGLSAAALVLCTATALSAPLVASESEGAPVLSYKEHAGTMLSTASLGLDQLEVSGSIAQDDVAAAPVVSHAIAPAFPAPETMVDEPADRDSRSLAELVADHSGAETPDAETECLARGVYWESKGEPLHGQLTVADVIINRSRSGRFASTVCGVLRQRGQFSFVRGGHIPAPPQSSRDWRIAVAIAQIAMQDLADGAAPRALFFHARRARPGWRLTRVATVGNHVFYR